MTVADSIRAKLTRGLSPTRLDIEDDSERHRGHGGAHPDGESHFAVTVVCDRFAGLPRVERHRLVHALLAEELAGRVHALRLCTLAPAEDLES